MKKLYIISLLLILSIAGKSQIIGGRVGPTGPTGTSGAAGATGPTGNSFKSFISWDFEASGRYSSTTTGTGAASYTSTGLSLNNGGNQGSANNAITLTNPSGAGSGGIFQGSPTYSISFTIMHGSMTNQCKVFTGLGATSVNTNDMTFLDNHIGFKVIGNGTNTILYATQGDGVTENASAALDTLASNDVLDLYLVVNGTSSVDYYYSVNKAAWSTVNLTSNLPTDTSENKASFEFTSVNQINVVSLIFHGGNYSR